MSELVPAYAPLPVAVPANAIPEREVLLAFLAGGYLRFGQWKKARAMFGLLHTLSASRTEYRIALGLACFHDGRVEEALAHLDETVGRKISESAADVPVWEALLLCRVLRANGMANEALAIFSYRMQAEEKPGAGARAK